VCGDPARNILIKNPGSLTLTVLNRISVYFVMKI